MREVLRTMTIEDKTMEMKIKDPDCIIVAKNKKWITLDFMMFNDKAVTIYLDKESAETIRDEIKIALKKGKK